MGSRYFRLNSGFSLLELIISVAILSVGIIAVLQAFSFSAQATGLSCDLINAVFLAQDKIQELEFKEAGNSLLEGAVKDARDKFNWEYALALDRDLDLYRLNLTVSWQRQRRLQSLGIASYLRHEKE